MRDAVDCEPHADGYEPPVLIELGDFFALTSGFSGNRMDFTSQQWHR
jgi:hypothetical protein